MNILLVPKGATLSSVPTSAVAAAELVITQDGQVLKDRNDDTWVKVLYATSPGTPRGANYPLGLARYVAVSPIDIRRVINGAIPEGGLTIDYRDAAGTLTTRRILPKSVQQDARGGNDTLLAYDLDKESWRTFLVSRIERVERDA